MNGRWPALLGQLGGLCVVAGLVAIFLGWNGAAGEWEVDAQIPYAISGGAGGLALVVLGVGLLVIQSARRDRAVLQASVEDLSRNVSRLVNGVADVAAAGALGGPVGGPAGATGVDLVVAGSDSFHRPDCRLVAGKDLPRITVAAAAAEGLEPCRVCRPPSTPAR